MKHMYVDIRQTYVEKGFGFVKKRPMCEPIVLGKICK